MLLTRTPYRLSIFGGGSDTRKNLNDSGNKVLNVGINKYSHCILRRLPKFFSNTHRLVYSKVEHLDCLSSSSHPVIRVALDYLNIKETMGLEIIHSGDLPSRSGVGSSSAFSAGLIKALNYFYKKENLDPYKLAQKSIEIERDVLKETGGIQDQVCAAFGGVSLFSFSYKDGIKHLVPKYAEELKYIIKNYFYLGYIPRNRNSYDVLNKINKRACESEVLKDTIKELSEVNQYCINKLENSENLFQDLCEGIKNTTLLKERVLELSDLNLSKDLLNSFNSLPFKCYKLMGGGGGGFFYVVSEDKLDIKELFKIIPHVKVWSRLLVSEEGSQLLLNYE